MVSKGALIYAVDAFVSSSEIVYFLIYTVLFPSSLKRNLQKKFRSKNNNNRLI